ncbi:hypothetical protein P7B02_07000 [Caulobacter segnis]|uniref:hypothetical protein n=1 Tax=Caulobacter segnis TaxID=88688 RepID=UPI002410A0D8|nr:hypothetical protein [Caulobacter segnis]MDG2521286.1 hypothetical protein [Caulobacter segnis]
MVAQVINLFRRPAALPEDWTQAEIAEFYRVESALIQAGLRIETDRGVSDEGEPWFVFCRADDGEVVIHFARIDGHYVISSPAYDGVAQGLNFQALVRNLLDRHPLVQTRKAANNNVFLHPAAILIAIVGTAFFKTGEAKADDGSSKSDTRRAMLTSTSTPTQVVAAPGEGTIKIDGAQAMAILTSAMLILQRDGALAQAPVGVSGASSALQGASSADAKDSMAGLFTTNEAHSALSFSPADPAIKSLLAVSAVLHDLPAAPGVMTPSVAVTAEPVASSSAIAPSPPSTSTASSLHAPVIERWQLEIDLRAASVPEVSAIRIVQTLAQGELAKVTVHQGALPDILAKFLTQAESVPINKVVAPVVEAQPGEGGSQSDPSAELPVLNPEPTVPVDNVDHNAVAKQIFDFFVAHTQRVEIVVTGDAVVLYDASLMRPSADWSDVTSVTLNFDDGSTISIVGHAHAIYEHLYGG